MTAGDQRSGLQAAFLQISNPAAVFGAVHQSLLVPADQAARCHSCIISWLAGVFSHHVCQAASHSTGGFVPYAHS